MPRRATGAEEKNAAVRGRTARRVRTLMVARWSLRQQQQLLSPKSRYLSSGITKLPSVPQTCGLIAVARKCATFSMPA